jgi:hypothetical protein
VGKSGEIYNPLFPSRSPLNPARKNKKIYKKIVKKGIDKG